MKYELIEVIPLSERGEVLARFGREVSVELDNEGALGEGVSKPDVRVPEDIHTRVVSRATSAVILMVE